MLTAQLGYKYTTCEDKGLWYFYGISKAINKLLCFLKEFGLVSHLEEVYMCVLGGGGGHITLEANLRNFSHPPQDTKADKESHLPSRDTWTDAQVPKEGIYTWFVKLGVQSITFQPAWFWYSSGGTLILSRKTATGCPRLSTPVSDKISGWCTVLIQLLIHVHQDAAFN